MTSPANRPAPSSGSSSSAFKPRARIKGNNIRHAIHCGTKEVVGGCISSSDWDLGKETSHEKFDYATCRPCLFFRSRPRTHLDRPRTHASARVKSQKQQTHYRSGTRGDIVFEIKCTVGCCQSAGIKATRSFASDSKTFTTATFINCPSVARARRGEGQPRARCVAGRHGICAWNSRTSFTSRGTDATRDQP